MFQSPEIDGEVLPVQQIPSESALAILEDPLPSLTPAQRELRRMVLDSVTSGSTRRNYGKALDDLFAFSSGPATLSGALAGVAGLDGLARSIDSKRPALGRPQAGSIWVSSRALAIDSKRRQADRERSQRLDRLGCGATVCQRDWN